jgi:hypothetical protein
MVVQGACVNDHISCLEVELEAIKAPGRRAIQVFPVGVVVRPVTGAFEAQAVVAERHGAAQVDAALVQRNPVRAIRILENGLGAKLVAEIGPFQQKVGILCQVHHIRFRLLAVEDTSLIDYEFIRRGCLENRFLPYVQRSAKLPRQVGVQHIQRASYRSRGRQAPDGQYRPVQEAPPREALFCNLCGLGAAAMQDFILLWGHRWFINTHKFFLSIVAFAHRSLLLGDEANSHLLPNILLSILKLTYY